MPYHYGSCMAFKRQHHLNICVKALAKPTRELLLFVSGFTESSFLMEDGGMYVLHCTTVSDVFFLQDTRWTKNHAWERCHCFPVFCFSSGGFKKSVWSIVVEPSPFVGTIPAEDEVLWMSGRHVPATLRPCWDGHFRNGFEAKEWWLLHITVIYWYDI